MTQYALASLTVILAPVAIKLTCFFLGYFIVRMGCRLLQQGVKGEFKFQGAFAGGRADLVSASPGLLFVVLGVVLIAYAMAVNKPIEVTSPGGAAPSPPPCARLPPMPSNSPQP